MLSDPNHTSSSAKPLRVLIVAEHASARFGGEAILPLHYFRMLRERGVDAWLIAHERTRTELVDLLPSEIGRITFTPDSRLNKAAWRISRFLPAKLSYTTVGYISRLATQLTARRLARQLVKDQAIDVVHQPIPVSPREPSLLFDVGAPVVMGPMNGNMSYPPGFRKEKLSRRGGWILLMAARWSASILHRIMPGKLKAAVLLVANDRTRAALPVSDMRNVIELVENGVDLSLWHPASKLAENAGETIRFIYAGRMIELKAIDILLDAFAQVGNNSMRLDLIGDGPVRPALEAQVNSLGLQDKVRFLGWKSQQECAEELRQTDVMVLPSLHECGGAVVLEAMACGVAVIATDWGGPADYLDATCGILVAPTSRDEFTKGLADAIARLAADRTLRKQLGEGGRRRAADFDWQRKVDVILSIYDDVRRNERRG